MRICIGYPTGPRRFFCWSIALSLAVFGCAAAPKGVFMADHAPASGDIKTLILLPMNFDVMPVPELVDGVPTLAAELGAYLSGAGFALKRLHLSRALEHWRASAKAVGGLTASPGRKLNGELYEAAREELARRVLSETRADAVLMATLVVREGRYVGVRLRWDGVKREVPIDTSKSQFSTEVIQGKDLGTSIRISLFDARGRRFFEHFGGLEPIFAYQYTAGVFIQEVKAIKEFRKDLFRSPEILKEGIALALRPWLTLEDPAPQS